jgi:short-subunit dehydrogenase
LGVKEDKRILIVGADFERGESVINEYIKEGAKLILTAKNEQALDILRNKYDKNIIAYELFEYEKNDFDTFVRKIGCIDGFVNVDEESGSETIDNGELFRNIRTDFLGPAGLINTFFKKNKLNKNSGIVLVSSIQEKKKSGLTRHDAAKAALLGYCQALVKGAALDICVMCI